MNLPNVHAIAAPGVRPISKRVIATAWVAIGGIYAWFISQWLFEHYIAGDMAHYRRFWDSVAFLPFSELGKSQKFLLNSGEPLYGLAVYFSASIMERSTFVALSSIALISSLILCLIKFDYPARLLPLILTNYYILVLLGPAERLKFGCLILVLALLATGWKRYALMLIAPLAHFQTAVMAGLTIVEANFQILASSGSHWQKFWRVALLFAVTVTASLYIISRFGTIIYEKATSYAEISNIFSTIPSFFALFVGVVFLKRKASSGFVLGILTVLAIVLGGSRVNMMTMIFLFAFFVRERRFYHPAILGLQLYFTFKSIGFLQQIYSTGTGFGP